MIDVNNFAYMKISLASPEKIRSWSYGEMDYSVKEFLVQQKTGNVLVGSTKELDIKTLNVINVELT